MGNTIRADCKFNREAVAVTSQDKRVQWAQSEIEVFSPDAAYYALSEQQISALLTAIAVIGWRTRWHNTEPTFYLEFGANLANQLMNPIDICALIADCIANNQTVQEALQNNRQDNGYYPSDPSYSNTDLTKVVPTNNTQINDGTKCNDDQLFGQATELTDYMYNMIQDLFDVIDLLGDSSAGVAEMLDRVPVLGKYLNAVPSATAWFLEAANNQWEAGYTSNLRDEIRCGIFCLMKDDCELTVSELVQFFSGNAGVTIEGNSLETIMGDMLSIVDGTTTVWAFHAFLAGVLETGGNWLGVNNVSSLAIQLALGANNPDSDWTILCDECPDVTLPCDFPMFVLDRDVQAVEPCVTLVDGSYGLLTNPSWIEGYTGYYLTRTGSGQFGARCIVDLPEVRDSVNVTFSMAFVFGSPQTVNHQWLVRVVDGSGVPISSDFMTQESLLTNQSYTRTIPVSYVGMARLQITAIVTNAGGTMSMAMYNIEIN